MLAEVKGAVRVWTAGSRITQYLRVDCREQDYTIPEGGQVIFYSCACRLHNHLEQRYRFYQIYCIPFTIIKEGSYFFYKEMEPLLF